MKTITLQRMELRNFKGVESADYAFSELTNITGGNATGKSTIYEAYLWCLFDKNAQGNAMKVQPLDSNNEVKHNLTTSVRLTLSIDGNEMIAERILSEDWVKPRGTTELVLKGTKSEYAINDVPMTKTQYNDKLAEIMPLDKWFNISSISIIPSMDQKTCRAALQEIAPKIDEAVLAEPFPAVKEAMQKGISVDELLAMTKRNRTKAQQELDGIPAAMDAQDRLRVTDDFEAVERELAQVNSDIENNKSALEELNKTAIDNESIKQMEEQRKQLQDINRQITEIESKAQMEQSRAKQSIQQELEKLAMESGIVNSQIKIQTQTSKNKVHEIELLKKNIATLGEDWQKKNAEVYQESAIETICPTCGQPLPAERVNTARQKAREAWNINKAELLQKLQAEAEECKKIIDKYNEENKNAIEQNAKLSLRIDEITATTKDLQKQLEEVPSAEQKIAENKEYKALCQRKQEMVDAINKQAEESHDDAEQRKNEEKAAKNAAIRELTAQRDGLLRRLAGRDTNARIDKERERLESQKKVLADTIAQAEGVEYQATAFRKAKITAVEEGVSSLFSMVHWKMYEANVTNDGEKEICQAIINGVPYEQQNRATQVNAGIDIVDAFATAYGVSAPLFIDNAESVTTIFQSIGQTITLTVVAGSELSITNI